MRKIYDLTVSQYQRIDPKYKSSIELQREENKIEALESTELKDIKGIGEKTMSILLSKGIKTKEELEVLTEEQVDSLWLPHFSVAPIKKLLKK